ncbi:MAG TPA: hypothetical protein VM733_10470 [Thermoanaerobaculia bacterium]|nr:hypothetical protein [Thermoanaerobaculia bacterium]
MRFTEKPRRKARLFLLLLMLAASGVTADEVADARKLSEARPQHPTLLYRLALALEKNGQREEAVRALERLAAMGFVYNVEKDFPHERYAEVRKRIARNAEPIGKSRREFTIDRIGLIPEGMAFDGKRFFVGSVRSKTIFADGKEFATARWGVFGMCADPKRGVLWATTTALPQVEGFVEEDKGKSALLKIDLRSGTVLETFVVEGAHHFGDVTVAPDGEVYVSDSASPVIYVLRKTLEPFVKRDFVSLQGLAVSGRTLYVADYSKGLFAIDRRTLDVQPLRVPSNVSLLGVDGIYAVDATTLVATQNGTSPNRIIRIRLAPGGLRVIAVDTLLANRPELGDPTLGVVANDRFFFNARGGWDLFGEDGKISDPLKLSEAVVLSVTVK